MPTTTNNGWTIPADTDLVKNGASAIRTLGNAIDSTLGVYSSSGLTLINTTSFSSSSSQSLNNVFSSTYDNYLILFQTTSASAQTRILARLRVGGVDESGGNYGTYGIGYDNGGTTRTTNLNSTTSWGIGEVNASDAWVGSTVLTLFSPFLAQKTKGVEQYSGITSSGSAFALSMSNLVQHYQPTSYDGITFFPASGNMTGTVSIYGYKK